MTRKDIKKVKLLPINKINILNPRTRNQRKFQEIIHNIETLGLKRPITVNLKNTNNGGYKYDLVCGQGRLEAYKALGKSKIPAVILDISQEECYLMSLVENLARRRYTTVELVREIQNLKKNGYSLKDISRKIDLGIEYVKGIIHLLDNGEERLLAAVECKKIPINIARMIADTEDKDIQRSLLDAYESKALKGQELKRAKKLIESRKGLGKAQFKKNNSHSKPVTAKTLIQIYQKETELLQHFINKAELAERRFLFVTTAIKELIDDENFVNLLKAESLDTIPKCLS